MWGVIYFLIYYVYLTPGGLPILIGKSINVFTSKGSAIISRILGLWFGSRHNNFIKSSLISSSYFSGIGGTTACIILMTNAGKFYRGNHVYTYVFRISAINLFIF